MAARVQHRAKGAAQIPRLWPGHGQRCPCADRLGVGCGAVAARLMGKGKGQRTRACRGEVGIEIGDDGRRVRPGRDRGLALGAQQRQPRPVGIAGQKIAVFLPVTIAGAKPCPQHDVARDQIIDTGRGLLRRCEIAPVDSPKRKRKRRCISVGAQRGEQKDKTKENLPHRMPSLLFSARICDSARDATHELGIPARAR